LIDKVQSMPTYKIKPGDSIFKISKNTGVPPEEIISLNNIKNNRIFAGQTLNLPYIRTPEEQRQIRLDEFLNREITNEERALLDAISSAEGTKGYGTIFGRKEVPGIAKGDYTIQEIIDMSLSKKYPDGTDVGYGTFKDDEGNILSSGATGRYQFMGKTLKGLLSDTLRLPSLLNEKFTPEMQDRLILKLLSSNYKITPESLKGGLTTELVNKLSAPFASFPTEKGVSRYPGQKAKPSQDIIDSYIKALELYQPQPINTSTSRWIVG